MAHRPVTNGTLLKSAIASSSVAAVLIPCGSYFLDGGILHGLAIALSIITVAALGLVLKRTSK